MVAVDATYNGGDHPAKEVSLAQLYAHVFEQDGQAAADRVAAAILGP